jgi:secondary thiamine-phosphate synthase enzyme
MNVKRKGRINTAGPGSGCAEPVWRMNPSYCRGNSLSGRKSLLQPGIVSIRFTIIFSHRPLPSLKTNIAEPERLLHYNIEKRVFFKRQKGGILMIYSDTISFSTKGFSDIIDITERVDAISKKANMRDGIITVFCPGSTGSVTTIEYESGVLSDLRRAIEMLVPSDIPYDHDRRWGDGNGFSHVRAALLKPSLTIPLVTGKLALGTWQQVVFIDFDNRPRKRKIVVTVIGK